MSNLTYNKSWASGYHELANQVGYESVKDSGLIPKDKDTAFQHLAVLYIRYIGIFKKLEDAYDQILHPQKKRLLKSVLGAVMTRLIEVKASIVDLECSDAHVYNDILLDMKLIPDDMRIPSPRYIVEDAEQVINQREKLLVELGARDLMFGENMSIFPAMSQEEAIKILQLNERGRQGKLRAKYMADIRLQAQREREMDTASDVKEVCQAANNIQRVYRGHLDRKKVQKMRFEENIFLNMEFAPQDIKNDATKKAESNRARRKVLQQQYEADYQQALINIKEKILKIEGPDMKEAIQDSFRLWYMEHKRIYGKFPEFPEDEVWKQAGFTFIPPVEGQTIVESELVKEETKDSGKDKAKDKKGKDEGDVGENQFKYDDSKYLEKIVTENKVYHDDWLVKDESDNFAQTYDPEIIKTSKRSEVECEIKNEVFEVLKDELKNLKLSLEKDKGKGKGGKKGGKGKKGKKRKRQKRKKGKGFDFK